MHAYSHDYSLYVVRCSSHNIMVAMTYLTLHYIYYHTNVTDMIHTYAMYACPAHTAQAF